MRLSTHLILLLIGSAAHGAEPTPEAIIRRALKQVGYPRPDQPVSLDTRFRVHGFDDSSAEVTLRMVGSTTGSQALAELKIQADKELTLVGLLLGKDRADVLIRNENEQGLHVVDARERRFYLQGFQGMRALWLLPLLHDKNLRMTYVSPTTHAMRKVNQIRVVPATGGALSLLFDQESGRLLRAEQSFTLSDEPETKIVIDLEDYRKVTPYRDDVDLLNQTYPAPYGREPLEYLKRLLAGLPSPTEQEKLIQQLGDREYKIRVQADERLKQQGDSALLWLGKYSGHEDREIAHRVKSVIEEGKKKDFPRKLAAVIRVVGAGHLEGSVALLMELIPTLSQESLQAALLEALETTANQNPKERAVLLEALKGPEFQRAFAAAALGRPEGKELNDRLRRRLPMPLVVAHRMIITTPSDKDFRVVMELENLEIHTHPDTKSIQKWSKAIKEAAGS